MATQTTKTATQTTKTATKTATKSAVKSFAIVANVAFPLDPILRGAFNAHHKERLIKSGDSGQVTQAGAVFFTNRERLTEADAHKLAVADGYEIKTSPTGYKWAIKNGIHWQAGSGKVGQALFAYALSVLTQSNK